MREIISQDNASIRLLRSLGTAKGRRDSGLFRVEGQVVIRELADGGYQPRILACTAPMADQWGALLARMQEQGTDVLLVSDGLLAGMTDTRTPQGMVAAYPSLVKEWGSMPVPERGIILALDALQDPGNMGSLIRTADALAVTAVLLLPGCVDPLNDKVVRASMGSLFRVPLLKASGAGTLDILAECGWRMLCGHLDGADFFSRPGDGPRCLLVVGNEASGVSEEVARRCHPVRLPMPGGAESLNAAVAGGIMLYDMIRRREACPNK